MSNVYDFTAYRNTGEIIKLRTDETREKIRVVEDAQDAMSKVHRQLINVVFSVRLNRASHDDPIREQMDTLLTTCNAISNTLDKERIQLMTDDLLAHDKASQSIP